MNNQMHPLGTTSAPKSNKKIYFAIGGVALIVVILLVLIFWAKSTDWFSKGGEPPVTPTIGPEASQEPYTPSEDAKKFTISGGDQAYPQFTKELVIDPFAVMAGGIQYFSIWVSDPLGVEKATLELETNEQKEVTGMRLIEGTAEQGRWLGVWTARNISAGQYYLAVFRAQNREGREKKINILWEVREGQIASVPTKERPFILRYLIPTVFALSECPMNESGDTTISSTCEVSGTSVTAGNLIITGSETIVLLKEDSTLGANGGNITIEDGTVQMMDRSSLFFNEGSLRNDLGHILMAEDVKISKGEVVPGECVCSAGDACCSDGCHYDADETICWTGEWTKECNWASPCDESANGTLSRPYKTCLAGSCSSSYVQIEAAICVRDTDGETCKVVSSGCSDCNWSSTCDELAPGHPVNDIYKCQAGRCLFDREVTSPATCWCRRNTEGNWCDAMFGSIGCSHSEQCSPCPGNFCMGYLYVPAFCDEDGYCMWNGKIFSYDRQDCCTKTKPY